MHESVFDFVQKMVSELEVKDKRVLEMGSRNINGSVKPIFLKLGCAEYVGIDKEMGVDVDIVMDGSDVVKNFGVESFDIVVSTETLEHVDRWEKFIENMKLACKRGGLIILTCRSAGFPPHNYPQDYWRFEIADIQKIFSDFIIEFLGKDPQAPGVFLKASKPKQLDR